MGGVHQTSNGKSSKSIVEGYPDYTPALLIDVPCSEGMIGIGPSAESAWQAAGLIDLLRGLADSVALGLSRQGDISRRQQAERGLDELGEMLIETELLNRLRRGLAGAASPAGMMDIVAEHALECSRSVGEVSR
jgi:hypothetical protein